MTTPTASRAAAASTTRKPVRFTFDGKTYTGLRRRHARLGAARQRRPPDGPLVQVPPPARRRLRRLRRAERADRHRPRPRPLRAEHPRHDPGALRRPRGDQPEPLAVARASTWARSTTPRARCSRPASTTRPSCGRESFWDQVYEPVIRGAAGLGVSPTEPDADRYASRFAHCDVLVVGAGPAGLAAALAAGRRRRRGHPRRRDRPSPAARCSPSARSPSTASPPGTGWPRRSAELAALPNVTRAAAHDGDRLLPPELPRPRASA